MPTEKNKSFSCLFRSLFVSLGMKVRDLIERLKEFNPESELEFVGSVEFGFGETTECISEECILQEEDDFVQLIVHGEEQ